MKKVLTVLTMAISLLILLSCETIVEPAISNNPSSNVKYTTASVICAVSGVTYVDSLFNNTSGMQSVDSLLINETDFSFLYRRDNIWNVENTKVKWYKLME